LLKHAFTIAADIVLGGILALGVAGALRNTWKVHAVAQVDPVGRSMTAGEIAFAQDLLGPLDCSKLRLHRAPPLGDLASVVGNDIYFENVALPPDIAAPGAGSAARSVLAHELTHVAQDQRMSTGAKIAAGLRELPGRVLYLLFDDARMYKFDPDSAKPFALENTEQQAQMVATYVTDRISVTEDSVCAIRTLDGLANASCAKAQQQSEQLAARIRPNLPLTF
jgi:hypothetical protein